MAERALAARGMHRERLGGATRPVLVGAEVCFEHPGALLQLQEGARDIAVGKRVVLGMCTNLAASAPASTRYYE